MPKIFISYRRDDSSSQAGRLYDRLEGHFGQGQVFMDVGGATNTEFGFKVMPVMQHWYCSSRWRWPRGRSQRIRYEINGRGEPLVTLSGDALDAISARGSATGGWW